MTTTLITNQLLLQRIGGVITIVMGLVFVGFVPALQREARFTPRQLSTIAGAPLLGAVFALGWTPCLGPTLTGVIAVASATDGANVARGVRPGDRLLPGAGNPVRAAGLWFGAGGAGAGLAAATHPRHPDLRRMLLILVGTALVTGVWSDFVSWVRDAFVSDVRLCRYEKPTCSRTAPQHLAHADVDGHGAGAAVPAGAGGDPRRAAAAAQPQRVQGRRSTSPSTRPSARGWTGCRPSTCSPASGSPRSMRCCSSRWWAA